MQDITPQIKQFSEITAWKGLIAIGFNWLVIATCIFAATSLPYWPIWIAAALIIGARQHALLVLMHEAAHYRLLENRKWGDIISNLFMAWPLFTNTAGYRGYHFPHHSNLNSEEDPVWQNQQIPDWEFPKTKIGMLWLLIKDLLGGGIIENIKLLRLMKKSGAVNFTFARVFYHVAVVAVICWMGWLTPFLLLWVVPALFLLPVLLRVRAIADHHGLEETHEFNSSRNTIGRWWERFFFFPHNIGMHLVHHLYPSIPFYNLRAADVLLQQDPEYKSLAHQSPTMTHILKDISK